MMVLPLKSNLTNNNLPKPTFEKAHTKLLTKPSNTSGNKKAPLFSPDSPHKKPSAPAEHSQDLSKTRIPPNSCQQTKTAGINPNIKSSLQQKSPTLTTPLNSTLQFSTHKEGTKPTTTFPKNHPITTMKSASTSQSTDSLTSSSSSNTLSNNNNSDSPILESSPSPFTPPSPRVGSTSTKKNSVRQTIKEYYKIEGLLEKNDEGLQLLRAYLSERRNDEMLIYLESNREFKLMRQNYSTNTPVNNTKDTNDRVGVALLREFKTTYENFVNYESLTCMNIASAIRDQFTQTLKEVIVLKQDEIPCQTLCEKMEKCLDTLLFNIQLQFNNEIMTHFKKSAEFRTFVITKLIELSASETSSIMDEMEKISPRSPGDCPINNILVENEMEEYSKTFAKKKLTTLEQIRNFTADDYRDKIGMKKIGHLKRIVRVVNEHFNKQQSSTTC